MAKKKRYTIKSLPGPGVHYVVWDTANDRKVSGGRMGSGFRDRVIAQGWADRMNTLAAMKGDAARKQYAHQHRLPMPSGNGAKKKAGKKPTAAEVKKALLEAVPKRGDIVGNVYDRTAKRLYKEFPDTPRPKVFESVKAYFDGALSALIKAGKLHRVRTSRGGVENRMETPWDKLKHGRAKAKKKAAKRPKAKKHGLRVGDRVEFNWSSRFRSPGTVTAVSGGRSPSHVRIKPDTEREGWWHYKDADVRKVGGAKKKKAPRATSSNGGKMSKERRAQVEKELARTRASKR